MIPSGRGSGLPHTTAACRPTPLPPAIPWDLQHFFSAGLAQRPQIHRVAARLGAALAATSLGRTWWPRRAASANLPPRVGTARRAVHAEPSVPLSSSPSTFLQEVVLFLIHTSLQGGARPRPAPAQTVSTVCQCRHASRLDSAASPSGQLHHQAAKPPREHTTSVCRRLVSFVTSWLRMRHGCAHRVLDSATELSKMPGVMTETTVIRAGGWPTDFVFMRSRRHSRSWHNKRRNRHLHQKRDFVFAAQVSQTRLTRMTLSH
jgi:hypothetical protein